MSLVARAAIFRSLKAIALSERGRKTFYYRRHFTQFEGDELEPEYGDLKEDEITRYNFLIEWGHVVLREVDDGHHEDDAPSGHTAIMSLSSSGYEMYVERSTPWYRKAALNIWTNLWSIVTAVLISWVLFYLGAPSK